MTPNPASPDPEDERRPLRHGTGIARHMLLRLGGIAAVVLAFTVFLVHHLTTEEIRDEIVAHAMSQVRSEALRLDGLVSNAGLIPRFLAARQQVLGPTHDAGWLVFFRELLTATPKDEIHGVYIAYAGMRWDEPGSSPWMDRRSFPHIDTWKYDFHKAPWYVGAAREHGLHITEPYFDKGGSDITMVSVTQAIRFNGELFAIAGADLSLERVKKLVDGVRAGAKWKNDARANSYLASREGRFLVHPDPEFLAAEGRDARALDELPFGKQIVGSADGHLRVEEDGKSQLVFWATAPLAGWKLILDVPEDLITTPADDVTAKTFVAALIGLGILLVLAGADARRISEPIQRLGQVATRFQRGDFNTPIPEELVRGRDEIADLALALRGMAEKIRSSREKELAEWNSSLEETVRNRTSELAQALKAAEEANRAKSAFLANMSHELRTPLNAIIGYSEMLAEEAADAGYTEALKDLEKIRNAGRHLLELISDVLDLSKIEADKMTIDLETIDLEVLLRDIRHTVLPLSEKQSNRFEISMPRPPGQMRSDSTKLRQILFNLLGNAFKFTTGGLVVLTVERFAGPDGDWMRFEVRDTGIGIQPEHLDRIFEVFTQADTSTTRKYGGTGLGLAITKRFSTMLGGSIRVASEPGKGSTFTVELPCHPHGS